MLLVILLTDDSRLCCLRYLLLEFSKPFMCVNLETLVAYKSTFHVGRIN